MTAPPAFAVSAQRPTPRAQPPVSSPRPLGQLIPRIRPYLWRLTLAFACLLASASIALAFPQIVRHLLDAAFISADAALLNKIALGLLLLFAIQGVLNFVQVYLLTSTSELVIAQLREDLFAHLVRLSPGFFTERRTGELTSRLSADTTVLQTVLSYNLSEFARQTLFLIGGIILLTVTDSRLTATTLAVVPIVVGAAVVFGRALRKASTGVQDRIAEATGTADEAFSQIRTVQSYTAEAEEVRRYGSHLHEVISAAIRRARGIRPARSRVFGEGSGEAVAVSAPGARRDRGRQCHVQLQSGAARSAAGCLTEDRRGRSRGTRGPERGRQDDDRIAAAAILGRYVGPNYVRRDRYPRSLSGRAPGRHRDRASGADALQRHDPREHRLRKDWRRWIAAERGSDSRGCEGRARSGIHRAATRRI